MNPTPNIPTALLGTIPDSAIAEQYNVKVGAVKYYRKSLGKAGVSPGTRGKPSQAAAYDHLLGKESDAEIGRMAGCAASAIRKRRRARDIPVCPHPGRVVPKRKPGGALSPDHEALLGTVSDAEIGRRSGVAARTVRTIRTRLGRPAWTPPKAGKAVPVPKPPRVRAPRARAKAAPKITPPPKPPPAPKPAPAPRSLTLREQLREQEPEPLPGSRARLELTVPTPVGDLSLFTARERNIIRDVRNGKPMDWIRRERKVSDEEIAELMAEAGK